MTLDPHIIRLRGPWQLEPVYRWVHRADGGFDQVHDDLPAATRAKMPADWSGAFGADFFGRVRYSRKFNCPTGLEVGERVFLVVEPPRSSAEVRLAGEAIGSIHPADSTARFDITERLEAHNRLEVLVDHPAAEDGPIQVDDPTELPPGGLVGEVRLEIMAAEESGS